MIQKGSGNCSVRARAGLAVFRPWVHGGFGHTEQMVPEPVKRALEYSSTCTEKLIYWELVNTGPLPSTSWVPSLYD